MNSLAHQIRRRIALLTLAAGLAVMPRLAPGASVLTFGDSLSKEYYLEFFLEFTFQGYPDQAQSWTEILDHFRGDEFDYGQEGGFPHPQVVYGHEFNWSIPGGRIRDFVDIVRGTDSDDRASRTRIRNQLQTEVDRFVLFVGGNDADSVYGTAYNGGDLSAFAADFVAGVEEVLDWVIAQNPALDHVLVNVPHVGATPKVKGEYPPDPIKTARATAAYAALNAQLQQVASSRGIGYADVFALTVRLLDPPSFCYQGVSFTNSSSAGGELDHLWLAGPAADDFHPNGNGQAVVANIIIQAFNEAYGSGIPPLTAQEILEEFLGMNADMPFAQWLACYGISGAEAGDDPDADGASNALEFALGLDPTHPDAAGTVTTALVDDGGAPALEIRFPQRLVESAEVAVVPQRSVDLKTWAPLATAMLPDGRTFARLPIDPAAPAFLRLRATLVNE